jgi:hypothetical protein
VAEVRLATATARTEVAVVSIIAVECEVRAGCALEENSRLSENDDERKGRMRERGSLRGKNKAVNDRGNDVVSRIAAMLGYNPKSKPHATAWQWFKFCSLHTLTPVCTGMDGLCYHFKHILRAHAHCCAHARRRQ